MKRLLTLLLLIASLSQVAHAQLPDGSTAPDWTMADINGITHNLYSYLDAEKVVFIDFSATWCGPCWNYHNTHAINNVYNDHAANVMAFMIEADQATNTDCLYNLPGCTGGTQGNWVNGTDYPIIDNHTQNGAYAIGYYPTIYGVCPDKKIYEVGQVGASALWAFAQGCSAPTLELVSVTDVSCYGNSNGAINVNAVGGISPVTYMWSNGATTLDISNLAPGTYTLTATGSLGGTNVLGPITVGGPTAPIAISSVDVTPEGCGGQGGTISVEMQGGTPDYSFQWSNGGSLPYMENLSAGVYSAIVTDANGCVFNTGNIEVEQPTYPIAFATANSSISCNNPSLALNGNGSSVGNEYVYYWTTPNGNIVSGENTLNDCIVNEPGDYQLMVINSNNNCASTEVATVTANTAAPNASAGPPGALTCAAPQTTLNGVGPTGPTYNILWTTTGGNIVSGATTLNPVVNGAGTYTLSITNNTNGCVGTSQTTVTTNIAPPSAAATGGQLTCTAASVTLGGSTNAATATYAWTGPNGYNSNQQNPTVNASGTYQLTVVNTANGCSGSATTEVTQNTAVPNASAQGGTLTCSANSVTIAGNSTTNGVTYAWAGPNGYNSNLQNPSVGAAGNYVLTVTGTNGCTQNATAVVGQNTTQPTASAGPNGVLNCNANQVVLNGSNSSSGSQYSYNWTTTNGHIVSGENTLTPTVDDDGAYSILVTNTTNGCTSTASTNVVLRQPVAATITSQANVLCNGTPSGTATAEGSGGNGTFSYAWSNGANTATASSLSAGSYTVSVTDGEGCGQTKTVTITQPAELVPNASASAQSAPGVNNGSATANPQGGTGAYSYEWNNGATTQSITDLAPGNYTVVVTDANGCQKTQTVTVNVFGCAVVATMQGEDVSCNGNADGAASIALNFASMPQTFLWSNGAQTQSISGLAVGTYSVTAHDGNGCEVVATIDIDQPSPLSANATTTGVTAAGASDGTATANPTGGTGPFTYEWSTGASTQTITGLASANYTVSVTDANGCVAVQSVPVAPFGCAALATITSSNISCFGEADGQATVSLTGGLTPFVYAWSNDANTATVSGLAAGTYSVSISDAVGCPAVAEVTITEPAALEVQLGQSSNADCGQTNGTATVVTSGGNANYNIVWSNGQTGATATDLAAGNYSVSVTDQNNCEAQLDVAITINDTEVPTVATQNLVLTLGSDGTATVTASQINNGSADNCSIATMTIDQGSFTCADLGTRQVTLTVMDEAGNESTGTATVEIVDEAAPSISVQNIALSLDENGAATLEPSMLDNNSTDNCGIAERTVDMSSFSCANIGQNAVVLTIADASGNTAAGTAIVTVQDNIAPAMTCPSNMVLPNCDAVAEFAAVQVSDNCAGNLVATQTAGMPSGATFPVGITVQTFKADDGHGNQNTCSFTVEVLPAMQVSLDANDVSCNGQSDGKVVATVNGGSQGYTYLWSNGATTESIIGLPAAQYTVSVTDAAGCTSVQSVTVAEPTVVSSLPISITPETVGQQNGAIDVDVTGGTQPYSYLWTAPNGNEISTEQDVDGLAAGIYTLEITDDNGCVSLHYFTVQSVSSVGQRQLERAISLFPNPTSGHVTIAFEEVDAMEAGIALYDLTGKLVTYFNNANIAAGQFRMDVSSYTEGLYLVKIMVENQIVTKRLVVQH
ncbi:MAG: T9SS type A sorting domain-containing protein [Saprospiraceae bacterium]|nr:T9SS type A sorting domain-containing protein [Saprospiraceae bacterium]